MKFTQAHIQIHHLNIAFTNLQITGLTAFYSRHLWLPKPVCWAAVMLLFLASNWVHWGGNQPVSHGEITRPTMLFFLWCFRHFWWATQLTTYSVFFIRHNLVINNIHRTRLKEAESNLEPQVPPIHSSANSHIHPFTPSFVHSLTRSLIHPFTPSLVHSSAHPPPHPFTPSLVHSSTHSLVHSFTPSLIHSFTHVIDNARQSSACSSAAVAMTPGEWGVIPPPPCRPPLLLLLLLLLFLLCIDRLGRWEDVYMEQEREDQANSSSIYEDGIGNIFQSWFLLPPYNLVCEWTKELICY